MRPSSNTVGPRKPTDKAVHDALASGKIKSLSAGKMGMGTREVGDMIAKLVS